MARGRVGEMGGRQGACATGSFLYRESPQRRERGGVLEDADMWIDETTSRLPSPQEALPGRAERMPVAAKHFVKGTPMEPPFPGLEMAMFGMGCFWGAERKFWETDGEIGRA